MEMYLDRSRRGPGVMRSIDWFTIGIYVVLLGLGWMSICGASYDFSQGTDLLSFSTRSGMQIVWIGTSLLLGAVILTLDERMFDTFSYLIYGAFLILLFITPLLARDIKGSESWIKLGRFSIQPAEFAKFATALAVAKFMSAYGYDIGRWRTLFSTMALVLVPMALIVAQKETGSALVYLSFFLMFYREGMPGAILFSGMAAVVYFVVGVRFAEDFLWNTPTSIGTFSVLLLIQLFALGMLRVYGYRSAPVWRWLGAVVGITLVAVAVACYVVPFDVAWIQIALCGALVVWLLHRALAKRLHEPALIALFVVGSLAFFYSVHGVMNHVLEDHQRKRIQVLLGLVEDPRGTGYNVAQAKIAIGSGGLMGKGFLNGTQTKLRYVPEQDTDFIFCTVGEEEGFVGAAGVLLLFLLLILRLIHVAERQPYAFGRVYGYCVVSIFLFHVFINVGMVLGLTPVIGIPLPFFSYGGSSLWGFTILLFIFLRIDAGRNRLKR